MKRGPHLPPDNERAYLPSHEVARCDTCHTCLVDEPVTLDGVRIGKLRMVCPHCAWGWPLDRGAQARHAHLTQPPAPPPSRTAIEYGRIGGRWRRRAEPFSADGAIRALTDFYLEHGRAPTQREMGGHGREWRLDGVPTLRALQKWFGSSREAFRLAGIPESALPARGYYAQLRNRHGRDAA